MAALALGATPALAGDTEVPTPAGDPFFGTFTDNLSLPLETQRSELDRQVATGVGMIREHIFWDRIEYAPGQFDFTRLDQLVGDAADRRLRIFPILTHPPAFYSSKPAGSTSSAQWPPQNPSDMGNFARALVSRYGPLGSFWCPPSSNCRPNYLPITHWQVWNEPDYPAWWKGKPDAFEYVPLLAAVYTAIKRVDAGAHVVAGGLSRTAPLNGYFDRMMLAGANLFFDSVGYHPYDRHVAGVTGLIKHMRTKLNGWGGNNKGLFISEYGWADGGTGITVASTNCAAALLYAMNRRLLELRAPQKLTGAVQFMWNDRPPLRNIWPYFAGLVRVDGTAKPQLGAFTASITGQPVPPGLTLQEACPADQQIT